MAKIVGLLCLSTLFSFCVGDELAADQTVIVHEKKEVDPVAGPPGNIQLTSYVNLTLIKKLVVFIGGYPWALLIDAGSTGLLLNVSFLYPCMH